MADLEVTGTADFIRIATALKALGKDGQILRRELRNELKDAARPMGDAVRANVGQYLPSGYAPIIAAGLTVTPTTSLRGATAGLRLTGTAKGVGRRRHIGTIDRGILRHPVYGHRGGWVNQSVRPGFWRDPIIDEADEAQKQIREAIRKAIQKAGL